MPQPVGADGLGLPSSEGAQQSTHAAKIEGQELLIMKESDIMGVLDEPVAKKKAAGPFPSPKQKFTE